MHHTSRKVGIACITILLLLADSDQRFGASKFAKLSKTSGIYSGNFSATRGVWSYH